MDYSQEARDRFDLWMVWPDRIATVAGFISLAIGGIVIMEAVSPTRLRYDDNFPVLLVVSSVSIAAFCALYVAVRFVSAVVVSGLAVRHRNQASSRASDHPAGRPDAPVQIARPL
jgi:hypothetical protein